MHCFKTCHCEDEWNYLEQTQHEERDPARTYQTAQRMRVREDIMYNNPYKKTHPCHLIF